MKDFKTLIAEATVNATGEVYFHEYTVGFCDMNLDDWKIAFKAGAALPNKLLLKALQALETYSNPEWPDTIATKTLQEIKETLQELAK